MGKISYFELTSNNTDEAKEFYTKALGWKFSDSPYIDGYYLAATGEGKGIDGALMTRKVDQTSIIWLEVEDLEATLKMVEKTGGKVDGEPSEIPGRGQVVYIWDPEGTVVGLIQPKD